MVLFMLLLLFLPVATSAQVVISEVHWSGSPISSADEWLELTNLGPEVDVSGWSLTRLSSGTDEPMITFASGTTMPAEAVWVISNYSAGGSALNLEPDSVTTAVSLSNNSLLLKLFDKDLALIDEVNDGSKPFAGSTGDTRASMERIDLTASGTQPDNWVAATASVNLSNNVLGSPGKRYSVPVASSSSSSSSISSLSSSTASVSTWLSSVSTSYSSLSAMSGSSSSIISLSHSSATSSNTSTGSTVASAHISSSSSVHSLSPNPNPTPIIISEILANPAGRDDIEWIEIVNVGDEPINIAGWQLRDSSSEYDIRERDDGATWLYPDMPMLFRKTESNLSLTNAGETVSLWSGSVLIDEVTYPETGEEISWARSRAGEWMPQCIPDERALNTFTPLQPRIHIQSGRATDYDKVTLNLEAVVDAGSLNDAKCHWKFGEWERSDKCNPPSHSFAELGAHKVQLAVETLCGNTLIQTLDAYVLAEKSAPKSSRSSVISTSRSSDSTSSLKSSAASVSSVCTPTVMTGVSISQLYPAPESHEDEWIELTNTHRKEITLCHLFLDDELEQGSKPFSLENITLPPLGSVKLYKEDTGIILNNNGDTAHVLFSGAVVSRLGYTSTTKGERISISSARLSTGSMIEAESELIEQKNYTKEPVQPTIWTKELAKKYDNIIPWQMSSSSIASQYAQLLTQTSLSENRGDVPASNPTPWILLIAQSSVVAVVSVWRMIS